MFRKTIAVLLLFSIVLSSCGKKDKDKSNDFVRVVPESPAPTSAATTPPVPAETPTLAPVATPGSQTPASATTTPPAPPAPPTPPPTVPAPPDSQSLKTQNKEDVKFLDKAVNDCIAVHLSCSVPSEACRKAQDEDPQRLKTAPWQDCIDSEPCSEKRETFLKARVDCFEAERDFLNLRCLVLKPS